MAVPQVPHSRWQRSPLQFSLWGLFVLTTMACVVAAAWALELLAGLFAYLACLLLLLTWWRVCADQRFAPRLETELRTEQLVRLSEGVLAVCGTALLAGATFLTVLFAAQFVVRKVIGPTWPRTRYPTQDEMRTAYRIGYVTLLASLPFATAASSLIYWLIRPRESQPKADGSVWDT